MLDFVGDWRYASVYNLAATGDFFGARFIYEQAPLRLLPFDYSAFRESESELTAVLTNCRTGLPAYFPVRDMRRDIDLVRASSSLPLLSRKVEVGGEWYVDGGAADSISLAKALRDGSSRCLIVFTQHHGYPKKQDAMLPVIRARYRRYPLFVEAVKTRCRRYRRYLRFWRTRTASPSGRFDFFWTRRYNMIVHALCA